MQDILSDIREILNQNKMINSQDVSKLIIDYTNKFNELVEYLNKDNNISNPIPYIKELHPYQIMQLFDQKTIEEIGTIFMKNLGYTHLPFDNEELFGNSTKYSKFIILANNRTGSSYLADLLQSHPRIICFGELFGKRQIHFSHNSYPQPDCDIILKIRNKNVSNFLDQFVFCEFSYKISQVGFKIFYEHALSPPINGIWDLLASMKNLKIIHLKRKNLLENLVSNKIAKITDSWKTEKQKHILQSKRDKSKLKINIDINECFSWFLRTEKNYQQYSDFFSQQKIHEVLYEDLAANTAETLTGIETFLDVEHHEMSSKLIKQNRNTLSDTINNYRELKEKFEGTKWHYFFED